MECIVARIGSRLPEIASFAEPPEPGPQEVLIRSLELGICGTDRDILESGQPHTPDNANTLILGHESLGRVEQVGPNVQGLAQGDLVVPVVRRPLVPVNDRHQRLRVDQLPMGYYTERGIVREHGFSAPWWLDRPEHLFRVEPSLAKIAVFAEPLSVAEKAINEAVLLQHARVQGEPWSSHPPRVLVTGMGPIAFAALLACRCRGFEVCVVGRDERNSFRVETVADFGATYHTFDELPLFTSDVETHGFELVLECTGNEQVMLSAVHVLKSCGVMVWLGASGSSTPCESDVTSLMRHAILRNHLHIGTVNAAHRDFRDALEHLHQAQRECPTALERIITDRVSMSEALWHYTNRRPQAIKVVIEFET